MIGNTGNMLMENNCLRKMILESDFDKGKGDFMEVFNALCRKTTLIHLEFDQFFCLYESAFLSLTHALRQQNSKFLSGLLVHGHGEFEGQ